MGTSYGASKFPSLFNSCILWAPLQHSAGVSGDIDEFPIIPTGVTVTNNGTFTKDDLGNNKSVLKFDETNNYISLSDITAWNFFNSDCTVSFWLRANAIEHQCFHISQLVDVNTYIGIGYASGPKFTVVGKVSGVTKFDYDIMGVTPTVGTWMHVIAIRSGSSLIFYKDGVSQTVTTNTAFNESVDIAASLTVGYSGYYYGTTGNIKDLMIFTRALSLPEIKLLMNRTHPVTGAGLIDTGRYWRLS
jgi:hypothetical protein